jgi:hypothetical protein
MGDSRRAAVTYPTANHVEDAEACTVGQRWLDASGLNSGDSRWAAVTYPTANHVEDAETFKVGRR